MNDTQHRSAIILVASDRQDEAVRIRQALAAEFDKVRTSTAADHALADFEEHSPAVLVLAFETLEKARQHEQNLYGQNQKMRLHPHRVLLLCAASEEAAAYQLCRDGVFDDAIVFPPGTGESVGLLLAVHRAVAGAALPASSPRPAAFAAQVRQLAEIEKVLAGNFAELDTIAPLPSPVAQWALNTRQGLQPFRDAARTLAAMAELVMPLILVVDDDEAQRDLVTSILANEKYRTVVASSGTDALNRLRRTTPDLVLMDMLMPDLDGLQTTLQIKSVPAYARLPIIMVTGKSDDDTVRESLKAGAMDFIVKPVKPTALVTKINRALRMASTVWPGTAGN